jgi:hypothetical protein
METPPNLFIIPSPFLTTRTSEADIIPIAIKVTMDSAKIIMAAGILTSVTFSSKKRMLTRKYKKRRTVVKI